MNSVERIRDYSSTEQVPREADWAIAGEPAIPRASAGSDKPADWPSAGGVEFRDLVMRYRPGLEPAVRGLTCRIHPREKIGVAGRTGSRVVVTFSVSMVEASNALASSNMKTTAFLEQPSTSNFFKSFPTAVLHFDIVTARSPL